MTKTYFTSLSAAITAINNGAAGTTTAEESSKVEVSTTSGELTKVKLMADVSESATVTVNADIDLVLNGYTLSFTEIGAYLHFETGTNSVIHGAGGAIVKNLDTAASGNAMLVSTEGSSLRIKGGTYSIDCNTIGTVLTLRAATTATATCDLFEMEDCTVEAKNPSGMAIGIQTSAQNTYVYHIKCDADGSGNSRGFMSTGIVKVEESHIVCNSTDSYSTAVCIMGGSTSVERCIFNATAETYVAYAIYIADGTVTIDSSDIRANAYNYWAYGIELIAGTLELAQSSVIATTHKGEIAGGHGINVGDKAKLKAYDCKIIADSTPNNADPGDNTTGIYNNGTTSIENSTVFGNFCAVYNCTAVKGDEEDIPPEPAKLYVKGGIYTGFCHGGFYFAHGHEGEAFVNDAIIRGGHYEGIFDYSEIPESTKLASMYIGGGSNEPNSSMVAYLDNCFFDASDCHRSIVVRGSSGEQNNTLNISNCTVTHGTLGQGTIRIDNDTLKLNIGRGCNSISDMFKNGYIILDEDGTSSQVQANYIEEGVVQYTGESYRKYPV